MVLSNICLEVFKLLIHEEICLANKRPDKRYGWGTVFLAGKVLWVAAPGGGVNVVVLM
jgi:hypothetical protein